MQDYHSVADALFMEAVSLVVDYQTPDGQDEHMSCQAVGRNVETIVAHVLRSMEAQGLKVTCLYTVDGGFDGDIPHELTSTEAREIIKSGRLRIWCLDGALRGVLGHLRGDMKH